MSRPRRPALEPEATRRNLEQLARLGDEVRRSRRARRLTQARLGEAVGVVQSTISMLERRHGGALSVDLWQRIFLELDRRLVTEASRDPRDEPADAGHLAMQELVIGLTRAAGWRADIEFATRPAEPRRSVDVVLRNDRRHRLMIVECWNSIGDVGAALRSTDRKRAEAEALATARWGDSGHQIGACWVVRATARNRGLVGCYPELFASRFPGSSVSWLAALTAGARPPLATGLLWSDVAATRLFPWRRPRRHAGGSAIRERFATSSERSSARS